MTNSDIVERLRQESLFIQSHQDGDVRAATAMDEAADTILSLKSEIEALRDALIAIMLRGPERDLKWAGMNAHDIARAALSGSPEG